MKKAEAAMPNFMGKGYDYVDDDGQWKIKDDAPDWAKKEFEDFVKSTNPEPDENGIITRY